MPRIKAQSGQVGLYHCMSRTVGGEFLLGDLEKETFVRMMWRLADFLGIEILGYVVMNNHYHQLLRLRARYFSDGLVLGSEIFVEKVFQQYRSHFGEKRKSGARAIKGWSGGSLKVIRDLRVDPVS